MDTQSNYYPYIENVKAVKQFFSKPIVLLCAIFGIIYAAAILCSFSVDIFTFLGSFSKSTYIAGFCSLLLASGLSVFFEALGLLILHIKSRSRKFSTLKTPLNFLLITLLTSASLIVLAFALMVIGMFDMFPMFESLNLATRLFLSLLLTIPLFLFTSVMAICIPCQLISLFVWLSGVKKSVCSVYLHRRGTTPCAVISLAEALSLLFYIYVGKSLTTLAVFAAAVTFYTLLAITAIKYNSYIKKCADASSLEPRAVHTVERPFPNEPSQSADDTDIKSGAPRVEPSLYEKLADFTPQSVDFSAMGSNNDEHKSTPSEEHKICPGCKTQCAATDKFCPRCGAALNNS